MSAKNVKVRLTFPLTVTSHRTPEDTVFASRRDDERSVIVNRSCPCLQRSRCAASTFLVVWIHFLHQLVSVLTMNAHNDDGDNEEDEVLSVASFIDDDEEHESFVRARQTHDLLMDNELLRQTKAASTQQVLRQIRDLHLTTLTFKDISLSAACMDALKLYVQDNATLETLILGGHGLHAAAATTFIQSLYRNTTLQNLVFYGQADAWQQCHTALKDLVRRNKSLKILFFSRIPMQSITFLADGLARNGTLQALSLDRCALTEEMFQGIVRGVCAPSCRVSLLFVQRNPGLGLASLQCALQATLWQNINKLAGLAFPGCPDILSTRAAWEHLVQFLQQQSRTTTRLRSLDIPHCTMSDVGRVAILRALQGNDFLESIALDVPTEAVLEQLTLNLPQYKALKSLRIGTAFAGIQAHISTLIQAIEQNTSLFHFIPCKELKLSPKEKQKIDFYTRRNRLEAIEQPMARFIWLARCNKNAASTRGGGCHGSAVPLSLVYHTLRTKLDLVPQPTASRKRTRP